MRDFESQIIDAAAELIRHRFRLARGHDRTRQQAALVSLHQIVDPIIVTAREFDPEVAGRARE